MVYLAVSEANISCGLAAVALIAAAVFAALGKDPPLH